MAFTWTTPRTWVAGELVTAAMLNTHVRDNLNALYSGVPGFRVRKAADTAGLTSGSLTPITFDTEDYDTDSLHDNVTNPTRITFSAVTAGVWDIRAHVQWVSNATGDRQLQFRVNGGANAIALAREPAVNGAVTAQVLATLYRFANGDYLELHAAQNSGGALAINGGVPHSPVLAGRWVSA